MKINRGVSFVCLMAFLCLTAALWSRKKNAGANSERSFQVNNIANGDVITGEFVLTSNVTGAKYDYMDVTLTVDGNFVQSQPSVRNQLSQQQIKLTLPTYQFSNGLHNVCVIGSAKKECYKVSFNNTIESSHCRDFNAVYSIRNSRGEPPVQGFFKAKVVNSKYATYWAVVIENENEKRVKTLIGTNRTINVSWIGDDEARQEVPNGRYFVRAGVGPDKDAALKDAVRNPIFGRIFKL